MCEYAGAETAASAAATEAVYSVKNATTEATQQPSMQDGHRSVYAKNIMAEHVAKQHADATAARGARKTTGQREAAPQERERTVTRWTKIPKRRPEVYIKSVPCYYDWSIFALIQVQ